MPTNTPVPPTPTPSPTQVPYVAERLSDVLGSAQTSYAGSIPERAWNVELAAKRLNGTKIAPGELFSFNQAVGPTTLAAGFRVGYGITSNNGRPETVPSVGGGICQVATTVFQAAFWAGLPFEERHYHLYWIPRYGVAPSGRTGMDATVDDPGVDLTFRNTTNDWIRLESWVDGANVGFTLKGVDPGWKVEATQPVISSVVKTSQAPVRQYDSSMPAGKELWVEHAEDGFTVSMKRRVSLDGKLIDDWAFTNVYQPSRNVLLVGGRAPATQPVAPGPAAVQPAPAAEAPANAVAPGPGQTEAPVQPAQPAPVQPAAIQPPAPAPAKSAPAPAAPAPAPKAPVPAGKLPSLKPMSQKQ
jgi:hypothetical protein